MNYCTLCDIKYLPRALALYKSLARWEDDINFWILGCDAETVRTIHQWTLENRFKGMQVTPLAALERHDPMLRHARNNRSWVEYLWTLASYYTWTLLQADAIRADGLSYLDADTYFFNDPYYLMPDNIPAIDIAIVPHRWTPKNRDRLRINGTYNVSWVYFSGSETSMRCAHEWSANCLEWCYKQNRRGGRHWIMYADQGYLEEWPNKYDAYVSQHPGVGLAPWNQERYSYQMVAWRASSSMPAIECRDSCNYMIVFYHFHEFQDREGKMIKRTYYPLHPFVEEHIYKPYEAEIEECYGEVYATSHQ